VAVVEAVAVEVEDKHEQQKNWNYDKERNDGSMWLDVGYGC